MSPLALILAAVAFGAGSSAPGSSDPASSSQDTALPPLVSLADPDITDIDERVRQVLDSLRRRIETLRSTPATSRRELAGAFGELGRAAMSYDLVELTEVCFTNAERLEPASWRWPYFLGVAYQSQLRWQEATPLFGRALLLRPDFRPATYRLGEALLMVGEPERSRELFEDLRTDGAWTAAAEYGLGRAEAAAGNWGEAATHFESVVARQPEAGEVGHRLGLVYRELGRLEDAREQLGREASGRVRFPDPLIEELGADYSRSTIYRALGAFEAGRFEEAAELYRQALEQDPENTSYRAALAAALAAGGDPEGAIAEYERATELEPDDAVAQVRLAQALVQRDGPGETALEHYESAVELAPELVEAQVGLGRVLAALGRHQEAIVAFDRALEVDPESAELRLARSEALASSGANQEAMEELERLLESSPDQVEAVLDLAALLARLGDVEGALARLAEASSGGHEWRDEDRALLAFNAAVLLQQQGEASKAIELYRQAVGSAPELKDAHFNLAVALGEGGRRSEAVEHLERVVEIDPDDGQAHRLLVAALLGEGRFAEGRAALERAHESLPEDLEVMQRLVHVLVASPDQAVRDVAMAAPLALRLAQAQPSLQNAALAAAALAGTGRFAEAARWQERAVAEAERLGLPADQLSRLRQELASLHQRESVN